MQDKYLDAIILERRRLTDRVSEFLIGAADGRALPLAEAGSHIELRFGGNESRFLRHYSIVGPLKDGADSEGFWRIAVQREPRSRGSAFIHANFQPGTRLCVSRPFNAFRLSRGKPHHLLVAGGIGITPVFAMARSLKARHESFSAAYLGAARSDMAYADEMEALCGDRLTLRETARQGVPDLRALLAVQPEGTQVYVCGPSGLIDALVAAGQALGWDPGRIRYEVFNAAHRPEDETFDVRLKGGAVVRVGAGTTILDALEAAGVETYADCRRGECGLCTTVVLGYDGDLDHRDHFFSDEDRSEGRQMTICCSRIAGRVLELDI